MDIMSQLTNLPTEVLTTILRLVGPNDLRKTLRVSKHWNSIAEPLVLERVKIDLSKRTGSYPSLLEGNSKDLPQKYKRYTKILFINNFCSCPGPDSCAPLPQVFLDRVRTLANLLPTMSSLVEVHFFAKFKRGLRMKFPFHIELKTCLLDFLANLDKVPTLRVVDIELIGMMFPELKIPNTQIIPLLTRILPRLQRMRLRLPEPDAHPFWIPPPRGSHQAYRSAILDLVINEVRFPGKSMMVQNPFAHLEFEEYPEEVLEDGSIADSPDQESWGNAKTWKERLTPEFLAENGLGGYDPDVDDEMVIVPAMKSETVAELCAALRSIDEGLPEPLKPTSFSFHHWYSANQQMVSFDPATDKGLNIRDFHEGADVRSYYGFDWEIAAKRARKV
ncbi:MAG: hypothetical protein M1814_004544 [Vezdaea aestivalis]|nr:MAG: hypothetical protein M1814_004544 [Vezdaea aestivalis]